jgi:sigma-B regulation protein RsbU (phosphoserine phosphatase)
MDVNMPEEDGIYACRKFKENAHTADIPIIFVSALSEVGSKVEGFQAGGVDYITKPYYPEEVLARVRLHIRMGHAYRALATAHINQVRSISQVQQKLLPSPTSVPEARFAGFYQACNQAGGDFYDVLQAGEGIFDYLVADVSGHDLGTSLPTAALKALIRQNAYMLFSPLESLRLLNKDLRPVLGDEQYVTLLYARLNRIQGKLTLMNAGHPPVVLVPRHGGAMRLIQSGDPLCMFDVITPDVLEIRVTPGDRLYLYTDGLTEQDAAGRTPRRQGQANLLAACEQVRHLPMDEAVTTIVHLLLPDSADLLDDLLLLAFEV